MNLIADSLLAGLQRKALERNQINVNLLRNVQWKPDPGHPESECGIDFVESGHLLAETLKGIRVEIGEWETISRYFLQHHGFIGVPKLWEIEGLDATQRCSIIV